MPTRLLALLQVALIAVLVSGCRSESTPPPATSSPQEQNWPDHLKDFRFRWSADPGFDLNTGWAVPLRAYLESWLVIYLTGDLDAGYPGFQRATPELAEKGSAEWSVAPYAQREIRGFRGHRDFVEPTVRIAGNEDLRVLQVEPIPTGFRAFVCDATFGAYTQSAGSPQFEPMKLASSLNTATPDFHNMKVWRIEFSDKDPRVGTSPPASPTVPQQGPLPAPRDDVFGPWFVTGATDVTFWYDTDFPDSKPGSPEQDQHFKDAHAAEDVMRQQCLDRYPLNAAQRATMATTVLDKPPTVGPAVPGWPES